MIVVTNYTYKVLPNERVDIRISPFGVSAELVFVALDGNILSPLPGAQPLYTIGFEWEPDTTHFCKIEASFFPSTPDDARFDISINGSEGGEARLSIGKSDPIHDPDLTFYCSGEGQRGHAEIEPPEPWPRPKRHR